MVSVGAYLCVFADTCAQTLEVGASIVWEKNFLVLDTAQVCVWDVPPDNLHCAPRTICLCTESNCKPLSTSTSMLTMVACVCVYMCACARVCVYVCVCMYVHIQELGLQIQWLDGDQSEHSSKNNRLKRRAKITNTQPASHDSNQDDSSKTVDSRIDPQIDTDSNISDSQDSDSDNDDYEDGLAIWDGSQFVMTQVSGSVWEYASLFWRYGASPHYYGQHANKVCVSHRAQFAWIALCAL